MKSLKNLNWLNKIVTLSLIPILTVPIIAVSCNKNSGSNNVAERKIEKKTAAQLKDEYYSVFKTYNTKVEELSRSLKPLKDKMGDKQITDEEKRSISYLIQALSTKAQQELPPLVEKYNQLFDQLRAAQKAEKTEIRTIKLYHSNDEHGRIEFDDGKYTKYSGMVRTSDYLKGKKRDILVSAGDMIQGLPLSDSDKGKTIVKMAKNMGYDAVAVGNHEFDYGLNHILELNKDSSAKDAQGRQMPFLSANIYYKDLAKLETKPEGYKQENVGKRVFEPYIIKELDNGMKAAIFGITTPDTVYTSHPKSSVLVEFRDPLESTKHVIQEIKAKHSDVNFFVALTHLGTGRNEIQWTSEYLAKNNPGDLDLIIDGHSHTYVKINNSENPNIWVTQTQAYTKYLGDIEIDFNVKTGKIVSVKQVLRNIDQIEIATAFQPKDTNDENHKLYTQLEMVFGKEGDTKLFNIPQDLPHSSTIVINKVPYAIGRATPTALGVFGANSLVWKTIKERLVEGKTGNESATIDNTVGLLNSGGLRTSLTAGEVKKKHMLAVSPFGNRLVVIKVTGKQLIEIMKYGLSKGRSGGFAQLSLNFSYETPVEKDTDPATGKPGYLWKPKVDTFKINGQPIVAEKHYYIATNDFLTAGGDGYSMINTGDKDKNVSLVYEGTKYIDTFIDYGKYVTNPENASKLSEANLEYSIEKLLQPDTINTKQKIVIPAEAFGK